MAANSEPGRLLLATLIVLTIISGLSTPSATWDLVTCLPRT